MDQGAKTLIIKGTGPITENGSSPWESEKDWSETVVIKEGPDSIPGCSFSTLDKMVILKISSTLTSISIDTITRCQSLNSINVSEENEVFSSKDGVLFKKGKTVLISCPVMKKDAMLY